MSRLSKSWIETMSDWMPTWPKRKTRLNGQDSEVQINKIPLRYRRPGANTAPPTFDQGKYEGNDDSSDCSDEEAFVEVMQPHQLIRPTSTPVQQRDLGVIRPNLEHLTIDDHVSSKDDVAKGSVRAENTQIGNPHMHETQGLPKISNGERVQKPTRQIDEDKDDKTLSTEKVGLNIGNIQSQNQQMHNGNFRKEDIGPMSRRPQPEPIDDFQGEPKAGNAWKAYPDEMQYEVRKPMYQLQGRPFPKEQESQNRNVYHYSTPGFSRETYDVARSPRFLRGNYEEPLDRYRLDRGQDPAQSYQYQGYSQKPVRRQRDPSKFNGESIEWSDYFRHFQTVATWNGWSETEKAMQLAMSMEGEAQRVLGDIPKEYMANFDILVNEMTRRFNPAERETAYRMEFRRRMRKPGAFQTAMQFGYENAIKRLASKAFHRCLSTPKNTGLSTNLFQDWEA